MHKELDIDYLINENNRLKKIIKENKQEIERLKMEIFNLRERINSPHSSFCDEFLAK